MKLGFQHVKRTAILSLASILLAGCASTESAKNGTTPGQANAAPVADMYTNAPALDLQISDWQYPYPVKRYATRFQKQPVTMAYMDVPAVGKTRGVVLMFHGKNFASDYWAPVIAGLTQAGYRVIAPDQIGFGKSSKPDVKYGFDELAGTTKQLLSSLGIKHVSVVGNSMGGMVAVRFARLYPQTVSKLVLENPLGLEDYSKDIPPQTNETLLKLEMAQTEQTYRRFMNSYFPTWKPDYEKFVEMYARVKNGPDYARYSLASVLTYQMIADQPTVQDLPKLTMPTLLIIGQKDRTVFGRRFAPPEAVKALGNFPALGKNAAQVIAHAQLVPVEQSGHVPHLEVPDFFNKTVIEFLQAPNLK
jgi:pimeloyl-ACP methyl ester carboxylesterase